MSSRKNIAVVRFPGTNCDRDVFKAVEKSGHIATWAWHEDQFSAQDFEAIVIPGGFSFGDYLRAGALASRSPVLNSVREAAARGVPVLGICNGFQILCEAGLLPGTLLKNKSQRFIDDWVTLKLANSNSHWASQLTLPSQVNLPIAHGMGQYYASADTVKELWDQGQVWFIYENNPNGSVENIAGVMNKEKNVMALMPHPERAMEEWMGGSDGQVFFGGER